jgi:DNA polymerase-3 subunit alpha
VFQLEGGGMRSLIKQLAPDRFEDIMALNALYRPGPLGMGTHVEYAERKHGRKPVEFPHPDLSEILGGTYGVIVYQEQVMQIAVRMAGYSMGEADLLRKAMGKKIRAELAKHHEAFVERCVERGYDRRLAESIFDLITPFADYGFNASHACAYALVGYQTAYLKAHHPTEYMAAILTSCKDDKDKKPYYLNACRLMGVEVLPPDVNESELDFAPVRGDEEGRVRYGLSAVRNVGAGAVAQIIEARRREGPFASFTQFCRTVDPGVLNKKTLESLIWAGAFDSLGYTRRGLAEGYEKILTPILSDRRAEAIGQDSLFGGDAGPAMDIDEASVIGREEYDKRILLRFEKEMLGEFVTDHPLLEIKQQLEAQTDMEVAEVAGLGDGDVVTVGGIVGAVARRYTKRSEPYALFRLEDLGGGVAVVAFPNTYEKAVDLIQTDRIVLVKGRVDLRGRELQLAALEIREFGGEDEPPVRLLGARIIVDVPAESCTQAFVATLKEVLAQHPGRVPVTVRYMGPNGVTPFKVGNGYYVDASAGLLSELRMLCGPECVRVEEADRPAVPARA